MIRGNTNIDRHNDGVWHLETTILQQTESPEGLSVLFKSLAVADASLSKQILGHNSNQVT